LGRHRLATLGYDQSLGYSQMAASIESRFLGKNNESVGGPVFYRS